MVAAIGGLDGESAGAVAWAELFFRFFSEEAKEVLAIVCWPVLLVEAAVKGELAALVFSAVGGTAAGRWGRVAAGLVAATWPASGPR